MTFKYEIDLILNEDKPMLLSLEDSLQPIYDYVDLTDNQATIPFFYYDYQQQYNRCGSAQDYQSGSFYYIYQQQYNNEIVYDNLRSEYNLIQILESQAVENIQTPLQLINTLDRNISQLKQQNFKQDKLSSKQYLHRFKVPKQKSFHSLIPANDPPKPKPYTYYQGKHPAPKQEHVIQIQRYQNQNISYSPQKNNKLHYDNISKTLSEMDSIEQEIINFCQTNNKLSVKQNRRPLAPCRGSNHLSGSANMQRVHTKLQDIEY